MLTKTLDHLMRVPHLLKNEAKEAMELILKGANSCQVAALLTLLSYRKERGEELAGMAEVLLEKGTPLSLPYPVLDIVGTGGDRTNSVNISTASAILAAACGVPIAKHGNRSVSSKSGSADFLEALQINIEVPPHEVQRSLKEVGIAFLFAPYYHPSLKALQSVRKELKIPTIFNLLGPLLNPVRPPYALIGVANRDALPLMGNAVLELGFHQKALIFHGNGMDELTPLGSIDALEIEKGHIRSFTIDPKKLGCPPCSLQDLQGGDAHQNGEILKEVFAGKKGAIADALVLNAGCALSVFGKTSSFETGVEMAREVLNKGGALEVLEKWVTFSKSLKKDHLEEIVKKKRFEVEKLPTAFVDPQPIKGDFIEALKAPGLSVIAEIKRKSPSKGVLKSIAEPLVLAHLYQKGGASAISVLTDTPGFGGTIGDLKEVSKLKIPTLRKDFIFDLRQLNESVEAGATAVLLIARLIGKDLELFLKASQTMGLEALVEIHSEAELKEALDAGASIIGVNHRDLKTFEIDLGLSYRLAPLIPSYIVKVAESGIRSKKEALEMASLGYEAILVGEALVLSDDPGELIKEFRR